MKAGECGAINVILDAMKTHVNNADICKEGCVALLSIAYNGEILSSKYKMTKFNKLDNNQVKVGECEAVDVILSVLKLHMFFIGMCYIGCSTLGIIVKNCRLLSQKHVII